jgi:RNA polymerase sigma-70 factor, ECF subfamily
MSEDVRVIAGQVSVSQAISVLRTETNDDTLELLVREHARLVYRVVYSVLRNHHDAEDATQETFVRVLRYRDKLSEVREAKSWLARIAWRVAVERRPKGEHVVLDEASESVADAGTRQPAAEHAVLQAEMQKMLQSLIASLPAKLRDPLLLSTLEELTPRDIAEVLGTKEAAVRSRLFRARQILRTRMTGLLEGKHAI